MSTPLGQVFEKMCKDFLPVFDPIWSEGMSRVHYDPETRTYDPSHLVIPRHSEFPMLNQQELLRAAETAASAAWSFRKMDPTYWQRASADRNFVAALKALSDAGYRAPTSTDLNDRRIYALDGEAIKIRLRGTYFLSAQPGEEPAVGLRLLDSNEHTTQYEIVTDQTALLNDPELSVFPSRLALTNHIAEKYPTSTFGTQRVFFDRIPIRLGTHSPCNLAVVNFNLVRGNGYNIREDLKQAILDSPLSFNFLERSDAESCCPPGYKVISSLQIVPGCPLYSFQPPVLTKAGKPKKSPGAAYAASRQKFLDRWLISESNRSLLGTLLSTLHSLTVIKHTTTVQNNTRYNHATHQTEHIPGELVMDHFDIAHQFTDYASYEKVNKPTWHSEFNSHSYYIDNVCDSLEELFHSRRNKIAAHDSQEIRFMTGDLRSALIYLHNRKRKEVLSALSLLSSYVTSLRNLTTLHKSPRKSAESEPKLSSSAISSYIDNCNRLITLLYKLARAMDCRSYPVPQPEPVPSEGNVPHDPVSIIVPPDHGPVLTTGSSDGSPGELDCEVRIGSGGQPDPDSHDAGSGPLGHECSPGDHHPVEDPPEDPQTSGGIPRDLDPVVCPAETPGPILGELVPHRSQHRPPVSRRLDLRKRNCGFWS